MKQILIYIISIFLFIGCNDQEMENITLHTQDIELQNAKKAIEFNRQTSNQGRITPNIYSIPQRM